MTVLDKVIYGQLTQHSFPSLIFISAKVTVHSLATYFFFLFQTNVCL